MTDLDRRSALAIGLCRSIGASFFPDDAAAQTYGPNEGKELTQGVRQVDLGDREYRNPRLPQGPPPRYCSATRSKDPVINDDE